MTKEKKERKQFNWRFKGDEAPELMEWFDNQRNITSSLESILNHIIEIYGTEDIMTHQTQKQLFKDSMLLESLKGQEVVSRPKLEQINKIKSEEDKAFEPLDEEADQVKDNHVEEDKVSKENAISEAEEMSEEEPGKDRRKIKKKSYMKDVNSKLL
jgi:hypothetical protein